MQVISIERIAELRGATDGLGARNRVHQLTNDELVALLDVANERNQLALERDMARRERDMAHERAAALAKETWSLSRERDDARDQRDAARTLTAGAERELQEVRTYLQGALADGISSYMTTPGIARAVASRVDDLVARVYRLTERARTGKFAGPSATRTPAPCGSDLLCIEDARKPDGIWHEAQCQQAASAPTVDRALAGMLRAVLSSIGLAPPDSWINGAAAGLAQLARDAGKADVGHRLVLSTEDVHTIAEALDDLLASTTRIVERSGGAQVIPAHADMVERQTRLLEMFDRLLDDAEAAKTGGAA